MLAVPLGRFLLSHSFFSTDIQREKENKPLGEIQVKKKNTKTKASEPRQGGKITVNFTPRVFPTPQRESKAAEENEVNTLDE